MRFMYDFTNRETCKTEQFISVTMDNRVIEAKFVKL